MHLRVNFFLVNLLVVDIETDKESKVILTEMKTDQVLLKDYCNKWMNDNNKETI